jgi:hypothetical protein
MRRMQFLNARSDTAELAACYVSKPKDGEDCARNASVNWYSDPFRILNVRRNMILLLSFTKVRPALALALSQICSSSLSPRDVLSGIYMLLDFTTVCT